MKQITIATLLAFAALIASAAPARAEVVGEQSQDQKFKQELEIKCENGSGQSGTCYAKGTQSGEQSQRQRILSAQSGQRVHIPVDTAMDVQTVSIVLAAAMIGLGSAALLTKIA